MGWIIGRDGVKRWADNNQPVECEACDFENAKRVGRAKFCCPNCGRDFSLEYLLWVEAAHPEWIGKSQL